MIIEISFGLIGGMNLGLEKSWKIIEDILIKYPGATWKKRINMKRGEGRYIVEIK